jgi:hypothetical protein
MAKYFAKNKFPDVKILSLIILLYEGKVFLVEARAREVGNWCISSLSFYFLNGSPRDFQLDTSFYTTTKRKVR